jgi:hypothetical protein
MGKDPGILSLLFLSPGTYFDSALNDLGRVGHYDLYSGTGIAVS